MVHRLGRLSSALLTFSLAISWFSLPTLAQEAGSSASAPGRVSLDTPWRSAVPPAPVVFLGWNGWGTSPTIPGNQAQAILAEPEVERFLQDMLRRLSGLPRQAMGNAPAAQRRAMGRVSATLVESIFKRSGCVFLEQLVPPTAGGPPQVSGGVWLEVGPAAADVLGDIQVLLADAPFGIESINQDGVTFLQADLGLGPETPVTLGVVDGCLLLTIGRETREKALQNKTAGKAPQWLMKAEAEHGLEQLQSLGHFNIEKLWAQMLPALLEAELDDQGLALVRSLGLEQLRRIETVDGFAHKQRVNRWQVVLDTENGAGLTGIWSLFDGPGIGRDAWQEMPADSLFAHSVAIDMQRSVQFFERLINQIDGPGSNPIAEIYEEFYEETGVDLEEDVLGSLGNVWSLHNGAADGWVSGMVATTELRDAARLSSALEKIIDSFQRETEFDSDAPRVEKLQVAGQTIYSLQFPGNPVPVLPSWTIQGGRLRMALFPDTLALPTESPAKSLLEQSAELRALLGTAQASDKLLMLSYVDMQRQFEVVYPYAQMMMAVMGNSLQGELGGGREAEAFSEMARGIVLPPARVIHRHLLPSVSMLTRNEAGFRYEVHSTFPAPDMTMAAPVAVGLLLPAVQQARAAARRAQSMNNLRQIALAALNFEATRKRLPAAYSQSDDGQPLLSWRVHILPFIEEGNLYDRFKLDEPWDSPHNLALLELMPATYRGPQSQAEPGHTVYLGVMGQNAAFGNPQQAGRGSAASGGRFATIVDGSSNTVMAVEVSDELAVPWTKPDAEIDLENFESWQFYGQFPGGTNAAFCDGSVRFLSFLDQETWKAILGINDGIVVPQLNSEW